MENDLGDTICQLEIPKPIICTSELIMYDIPNNISAKLHKERRRYKYLIGQNTTSEYDRNRMIEWNKALSDRILEGYSHEDTITSK